MESIFDVTFSEFRYILLYVFWKKSLDFQISKSRCVDAKYVCRIWKKILSAGNFAHFSSHCTFAATHSLWKSTSKIVILFFRNSFLLDLELWLLKPPWILSLVYTFAFFFVFLNKKDKVSCFCLANSLGSLFRGSGQLTKET